MQYVHFIALPISSTDAVDTASIFEGHEIHELPRDYELALNLPLSSICSFRNASYRIEDSKEAFISSSAALFDILHRYISVFMYINISCIYKSAYAIDYYK